MNLTYFLFFKCQLEWFPRPVLLETPTVIELAPGRNVRVTLFDANHCVTACMFLLEGNGKARQTQRKRGLEARGSRGRLSEKR